MATDKTSLQQTILQLHSLIFDGTDSGSQIDHLKASGIDLPPQRYCIKQKSTAKQEHKLMRIKQEQNQQL